MNCEYYKTYDEAETAIKATGAKRHHCALSRGYRRSRDEKPYLVKEYWGNFGKGFILAKPTKESHCSNDYHQIEYYIYAD